MPVFEESAAATARKCSDIYTQRGGEYKDTWALEHQTHTFLDAVLDEAGSDYFPVKLPDDLKRLMKLADLIDVKEDRMLGGYKEDTLVDGVNYRLVFADLMDQFRRTPKMTTIRPQLEGDKRA